MPSSVKLKLQRATLPDGPLDPSETLWFKEALRRSPFHKVPAGEQEETFEWVKMPANGLLEGDVYTDGFLMDNEPEVEGNCKPIGCSFVILGSSSSVHRHYLWSGALGC